MEPPLEASDLYEALRGKADVRYSHRYVGYHGAIVVSVGLQLNPTLLRLTLCRNSIGASGATAIAEALKVKSSLQTIHFFKNNVGDTGAAAFAEAL
jgi:hypothetical protein